jgi:FixJ family two-component response regulator
MPVETYGSAQEFLERYTPDRPGCLVLDVRMPRMSGLELQEHFNSKGVHIPIIFVSGHGDVPIAVRAIKNGAVQFLEKPFSKQLLLEFIHEALNRDQRVRKSEAARPKFSADALTDRAPGDGRVVAGRSLGSRRRIGHQKKKSTCIRACDERSGRIRRQLVELVLRARPCTAGTV